MYFHSNQGCQPGTQEYVIKNGDTLYDIAKQFNTSIREILRANPFVNPNRMYVGQRICVPSQMRRPRCPGGRYYTIQRGDTLNAIADRYNLPIKDIINANPGIEPNQLFVGQVICLPIRTPQARCPRGTRPYRVKAGDNLYSISIDFNTTIQNIIRANPNIDPDKLNVGQIICIPAVPQMRCPRGTVVYEIEAGDNLYGLAEKYNTTLRDIIAINPNINPNNLIIGQKICVPRTRYTTG